LVKLAVHTIGLINEDKGGLVDLFPDFLEWIGVACELGPELVKTALFSILLEDLPDEVQCSIGLCPELFYLRFERDDSLPVPGFFGGVAPGTERGYDDSSGGDAESQICDVSAIGTAVDSGEVDRNRDGPACRLVGFLKQIFYFVFCHSLLCN